MLMRMRSINRETNEDPNFSPRSKKNSFFEVLKKVVDNGSRVRSQCEGCNQNNCEVSIEDAKKARDEENPTNKVHSLRPSTAKSLETSNARKKPAASELGSKSLNPCGLENLGNTCYLNAILQCLRSTKPVCDFCENYDSGRTKPPKNSTDLVPAFTYVITKMNSVTNGSVTSNTLQRFKNAFAARVPTYKGNLQQDALEFFTYILDGLHEGIKERSHTPSTAEPPSTPTGFTSPMPPIQRDRRLKRRRGGLKNSENSGHLTGGDRSASWSGPSDFSSLKRISKKVTDFLRPNRMEGSYDVLHDVSQPAVSSADATASENSFLKDTFVGHLQTRLRCLQCNNLSTRDELFWNLALCVPEVPSSEKECKENSQKRATSKTPVSPSASEVSSTTANICVSLDDCLKAFTKTETLDDVDKPMCSKCKSRCKAELQVKISKLPKILVLQFQRFESSCCKNKKRNLIKFGFEQDMAPYYIDAPADEKTAIPEGETSAIPKCSDSPIIQHSSDDSISVSPMTASKSTVNIETPVSTQYRLYAVVYHQGGTDRGHYTARCRLSNIPNHGQDSWYFFDDENVSKVPADHEVIHPTAYILFYERIDGSDSCECSISVDRSGGSDLANGEDTSEVHNIRQ